MKHVHKALLLAAGILCIAFLARLGIVPLEVAQFAPFMLLALFPGAWLRSGRSRNCLSRSES